MTIRTDLLALTEDSLAALTNRGLVKRAAKEIERGAPTVTVGDAGIVRGAFPDGVTSELPAGGLDAGRCSCGATSVCRHLLALVLAYQRANTGAGAQTPFAVWSPGEFTDEQLTQLLGARLFAAARRAERAGYLATVHRPTAADPAPHVELSAASVRFLVPHDLTFAHTDIAAGARGEVLALAVWAFRAADQIAPGARDVQVQVGGDSAASSGSGTGLEPALQLAGTVLRQGAVHLGAGIDAALTDEQARLDTLGLRWPQLAVEDLADQLAAYRERSARYHPEQLEHLLVEVHARHRAAADASAARRVRVLGTEEAAEAALRRVRLDALGARVSGLGDERVVELFYAHADTATVLVLRRTWQTGEDGPALARHRVSGATVGALAAASVVTESAVRSASRRIRLAAGRVAKTTVSPSQGRWDSLPDALLVRDLGALGAYLDALPPRVVRPRIDAELVRAIEIAEVRTLSYGPGSQRLDAVVADQTGATATVTATHSVATPGRLDAIAQVLGGERGPVRYVSGSVHRTGGGVVIEPMAFAVEAGLVVPDLAPATAGHLAAAPGAHPAGLAGVLGHARSLLAEVAHRGLLHLPASFPARLRGAAQQLTGHGLGRAALAVERFAAVLGPDPGEEAVLAWVDAALRLTVAADLC